MSHDMVQPPYDGYSNNGGYSQQGQNGYQPRLGVIADAAAPDGLADHAITTPGIDGADGEVAAESPVIAVRNLTKTYHLGQTKVRALRGVSLEIRRGEFVAIMGPSGSGKSTFMNLLGCLDQPTSGDYLLMGQLVSRMTPDQLADVRNWRVGFVFQGFNLLPRATALKNVALPLVYRGMPSEEQERRARRVLDVVGLRARANHKPAQLSGGQQQRVAIARALVTGPSLLLADEPTGNLDSTTSVEIMAILQALNERGLTIVLVTHEHDIAAYARRQILFRDGRVVHDELISTQRSARAEWEEQRMHGSSDKPLIEGGEEKGL
jgi:putative ABC transport system ATP-binding protein